MKQATNGERMGGFAEDDLILWPYHKAYLIDILNGDYDLEEARRDLRSLVGSYFDPRAAHEAADKEKDK